MKTELLRRVCVLTMILFPVVAVAQVSSTGSHGGSSSAAVSVPFFVDDSHGKPVGGVDEANLSILDNKKPPQSVVSIQATKSLPLRLGLLIDVSKSQAHNELYRPGIQAGLGFLRQVLTGPDDKAFIVTFASVPGFSKFTSREELLAYKIDFTPRGGTTLFDAIYVSCHERMRNDPTESARRVLVILSDGDDNESQASRDQVIAAAQATGTVIFTVSTSDGPDDRGSATLRKLAEQTGGHAFLYLTRKGIIQALPNIMGQIDNMYSATYIPAESGDGNFHSVELKSTSGTKLKIRAPKGYYVVPSSDSKR